MVSMRWEGPLPPQEINRPRLLSLAVAVLTALAFVLSLAAAGGGVLAGDTTITLLVQDHLPAELTHLFEAVNWLGTTAVAVVLSLMIGITLLVLRQPLAAALVALSLPVRASNVFLKEIFESPRPNGAAVSVTEYAHGFGFPSGHTMGACLLYGLLFLLAPRLTSRRPLQHVIRVGALSMIVLAGISRVYVGAHWPSDVLGAYLWGTALLLAMWGIAHTVPARRSA